jgi:hypothetical protein
MVRYVCGYGFSFKFISWTEGSAVMMCLKSGTQETRAG